MQLLGIWNKASRQCISLLMACLLGVAATSSHAASPQVKTFADGSAQVTFSFELGSDFAFDALTLLLDFDTAVMSVAAASPAQAFVNDVLFASSDAETLLPNDVTTYLFLEQNDGLGASAILFALPGTSVSGTLSLTLPFQLSGAAPTLVTFSGDLAGNGDSVPLAAANFTVTPVPEPETLLLWLGGGALLAAATRRRRAEA